MPRDLSYGAAIALAAREGYHPLQILLRNMADLQRAAEREKDPDKQFDLLTRAGEAAAKAAPYCHPRAGTINGDDL